MGVRTAAIASSTSRRKHQRSNARPNATQCAWGCACTVCCAADLRLFNERRRDRGAVQAAAGRCLPSWILPESRSWQGDSELFQRHPGNPILTAASWPYPHIRCSTRVQHCCRPGRRSCSCESRTIPHRKSGVRFDIQGVHVSVADFLPFRIISRLKGSPDYQSSRGGCAPNESQQRLPGSQGHASPVATDLAKQSVLDGIPLGQGVMMPVSRIASYMVNEYA